MTALYEKYRPKTWTDVIGQKKAVNRLRTVTARGIGGRAFWISGQTGTGKTTLAYLLAAEIAVTFNVQELDASDLTPAKLHDLEWSGGMHTYGLGSKGGRAYIVNEAHGLRRDTVRQLLVLLERLPGHVVFVFTTTFEGQSDLFDKGTADAAALLSRCIVVNLARRDLARAFAERVRDVATLEGLNGRPLEDYVKLARKTQNNMRAMYQAVESGEMV